MKFSHSYVLIRAEKVCADRSEDVFADGQKLYHFQNFCVSIEQRIQILDGSFGCFTTVHPLRYTGICSDSPNDSFLPLRFSHVGGK